MDGDAISGLTHVGPRNYVGVKIGWIHSQLWGQCGQCDILPN